MNFNDRFNDERYIDLTAYCAMRNIERSNRRTPQSEDWGFHRGDIYTACLDPVFGSEQGGTRPVVVLQSNTGCYYCPTLIVAPLTSGRLKKPNQPTHYRIEGFGKLGNNSVVLLEQIKTIDKRRIIRYIGKLTDEQTDGINEALERSLGLHIPEEIEAP